MINLQGVAELTPSQAQRIYRQYGREAWLVLQRDPYRLAEEVRGFGFKTCDRIARKLGMDQRRAGALAGGAGVPAAGGAGRGAPVDSRTDLVQEAAELLEVSSDLLPPRIEALVEQGRVIREEMGEGEEATTGYYLPAVAVTEERIAERLAYLLRRPPHARLSLSPEEAQDLVMRKGQDTLTPSNGRRSSAC